jgi:ferredoxin, 2Fe-2S
MSIEITVANTGEKVSLEAENLLVALRKKGVRIRSSCGGHATCSDCIVKVKSGDKNFSQVNFEEKKLLGNVYYITKERLACQLIMSSETEESSSEAEIEVVNLDP